MSLSTHPSHGYSPRLHSTGIPSYWATLPPTSRGRPLAPCPWVVRSHGLVPRESLSCEPVQNEAAHHLLPAGDPSPSRSAPTRRRPRSLPPPRTTAMSRRRCCPSDPALWFVAPQRKKLSDHGVGHPWHRNANMSGISTARGRSPMLWRCGMYGWRGSSKFGGPLAFRRYARLIVGVTTIRQLQQIRSYGSHGCLPLPGSPSLPPVTSSISAFTPWP